MNSSKINIDIIKIIENKIQKNANDNIFGHIKGFSRKNS
jgi:hypothetical protein